MIQKLSHHLNYMVGYIIKRLTSFYTLELVASSRKVGEVKKRQQVIIIKSHSASQ